MLIRILLFTLFLTAGPYGWSAQRHGTTSTAEPILRGTTGNSPIIYFSEDFSDGRIPVGWSNEDPSGNNALWNHCEDPTAEQGNGNTGSCPGIWDDSDNQQTAFASTTASNGFVTMDSSVVNSSQQHVSELTTPSIDLSQASKVVVSFQSHIGARIFNPNENALFQVSVDGGSNWSDYQPFPNLVIGFPAAPPTIRWSSNATYSQFDISDIAAGQPNVLLRWQWSGFLEYHWNLDDVFVSDRFIFFAEDFSDGRIPADWTTADPSGNNGLWTYCADPTTGQANGCPPFWDDGLNAQVPFAASTASNGFVTVDSDLIGEITTPHVSQLNMTPLNFSQATSVGIGFEGHIGVFSQPASTNALLRVSNDGGISWSEYFIYPDLVPGSPMPPNVRWSFNPEVSFIDISSVAAGQEYVLIQWQWTGRFEYLWSLDDVIITEVPPPDLIFTDGFDITGTP